MTTLGCDRPASAPDTKCSARRLSQRMAAAALVVGIALAVAGCGGGSSKSSSGSTTGGTTNAASAQQSGVAYAQCMRSHGVANFPDNAVSSSGGGTKVNLPQGIISNPDYRSASQACQSQLPKGASGGNSSANVQAELKWANCMRAHGVTNAPEPDSQGRIIMGGNSGVDPNSPTFQSAMQSCRSDLPNGGLGAGG